MSENQKTNRFKNFADFIFRKSIKVIPFLVSIIPVIDFVCNFLYKNNCEKFYNIPARYFSQSIYNTLILAFFAVLLVVLAIIPAIKQHWERNKNRLSTLKTVYNVSLSVGIGLVAGLMNTLYLIETINLFSEINYPYNSISSLFFSIDENIFIVIILAITLICVLGLLFNYKFPNIRNRFLKYSVSIIVALSIAFNILMVIGGITTRFINSYSIQYKTKYEIASVQDEKFAVLSDYENKKLVVKFDILDNNGQKTYTFKTNEYFFIDPDECTFSYIDTIYPPTIKK